LLEILHVKADNPEPPWLEAGAASPAAASDNGVTDLDGGSASTFRVVHIDVRTSASLPCSSLAALSELRPAYPELKRTFPLLSCPGLTLA
jgi:hypothetical protein